MNPQDSATNPRLEFRSKPFNATGLLVAVTFNVFVVAMLSAIACGVLWVWSHLF